MMNKMNDYLSYFHIKKKNCVLVFSENSCIYLNVFPTNKFGFLN